MIIILNYDFFSYFDIFNPIFREHAGISKVGQWPWYLNCVIGFNKNYNAKIKLILIWFYNFSNPVNNFWFNTKVVYTRDNFKEYIVIPIPIPRDDDQPIGDVDFNSTT